MYCPKCWTKTGVYNGFYEDDECTKYARRRKCPECGHRFITLEQIVGEPIQGAGTHGGARKRRGKLADIIKGAEAKC